MSKKKKVNIWLFNKNGKSVKQMSYSPDMVQTYSKENGGLNLDLYLSKP